MLPELQIPITRIDSRLMFFGIVSNIPNLGWLQIGMAIKARIGVPECAMNFYHYACIGQQKVEHIAPETGLPLIAHTNRIKNCGKSTLQLIVCFPSMALLYLFGCKFGMAIAGFLSAKLPNVGGADFLSGFWRMSAPIHAVGLSWFCITQNSGESAQGFQDYRTRAAIKCPYLIRSHTPLIKANQFRPFTFGYLRHSLIGAIFRAKTPAPRFRVRRPYRPFYYRPALLAQRLIHNTSLSRSIAVTWNRATWKANGGYGSQGNGRGRANAGREVVWFSPACINPIDTLPLFAAQKENNQ